MSPKLYRVPACCLRVSPWVPRLSESSQRSVTFLIISARTLAPADRDDHAAVESALQRFIALLIEDHHNALV